MLISVGLAGFGWPSNQKEVSSSPPSGDEPIEIEAARTPGVELSLSLNWRKLARIASGLALRISGGMDTPKVMALSARKPGSTFQTAPRLSITQPPHITRPTRQGIPTPIRAC